MSDETGWLAAEFEREYRIASHPALLRFERQTLGSDYGATSYTTRDQADRLADLLSLDPSMTLLDIGSGAGWPGIYLAKSTGCRVILSDPIRSGLEVAARRMDKEGVKGTVIEVDGASLPLEDQSVDAVTCSDVFC